MKFRFRPSSAKRRLPAPDQARKALRLKGINTLRAKKYNALVRSHSAHSFGAFEEGQRSRRRFSLKQKARLLKIRLRRRIEKYLAREPKVSLVTLVKILLVTFGIALLSGMTVLFSLFFTYAGSYTEVRIPDFSVMTLEEALALSNDIFEYDTVYESNPEYDGGDIISQKPSAGVLRKVYKKDGKLKITLTVNKDTEYFTLPPLQGKPIRDALLGLRSMGIKTKIINEYSPTVPVGAIISSSHSSGTRIKKGDTVTLKVSLGKEILQVSVPDLVGKSERDALTLLSANRLDVGVVVYKASNERIGTVISQGTAAKSTVREGSKISFCVSAGPYYSSE